MFFKRHFVSFICLSLVFFSYLAFAGQSMPTEVKAEFSQYPGSEVINTIAQGERVQAMLFCVGASPDDVYDYYMDEIEHGGWNVLMNTKTGIYQIMLEKNKKEASIVITSEDNETYALLSITK